MKKYFLLFLLFLFNIICIHAQEEKLIWIDRSGNTIDPAADYTDEEYDGVIIYRENNKYGFKNPVGQIKVEARYDLAKNIGKGFAAFAYSPTSGDPICYLFNQNGKMVHGSPFKKIFSVNGATEDEPYFYDGLLAIQSISIGKVGCIDTSGHLVVPEIYDYIRDIGDPVLYIGKNGVQGLMNKKTKEEILTKYDQIKEFSQGLAAVSKKGKWGYINYEGKEVIAAKFNSAGYFFDDHASVITDEKANKIINLKGEIIENAAYVWSFQVMQIYENAMFVKNEKQMSALADRFTGKYLTGFNFKNDPRFVDDYAACVDTTDACFLINRKGQAIIKGYDGFGNMNEGLICAWKKETVKDASGKILTLEKSGYLDARGNIIIPFNFGGIGCFRNGLALVMKFEDYKNYMIAKQKK
ncbi:MAG: WG repeat-containing protein [Cytophagaceae bacterium]|nr:WG repeat-containing protein [Cytophagaceae bacterium]